MFDSSEMITTEKNHYYKKKNKSKSWFSIYPATLEHLDNLGGIFTIYRQSGWWVKLQHPYYISVI